MALPVGSVRRHTPACLCPFDKLRTCHSHKGMSILVSRNTVICRRRTSQAIVPANAPPLCKFREATLAGTMPWKVRLQQNAVFLESKTYMPLCCSVYHRSGSVTRQMAAQHTSSGCCIMAHNARHSSHTCTSGFLLAVSTEDTSLVLMSTPAKACSLIRHEAWHCPLPVQGAGAHDNILCSKVVMARVLHGERYITNTYLSLQCKQLTGGVQA